MLEIGLKEKHFENVKAGKKTAEGRLLKDKFEGLKNGDSVIIYKDLENGTRTDEKIMAKIKDIEQFDDVLSMLKGKKLSSILPGVKSYNKGVEVYEEIYGNQLKNGKMVAFSLDVSTNVPEVKHNNHVNKVNEVKHNNHHEENHKKKYENRDKLIQELTEKSNSPKTYELYIKAPWMALIRSGLKEVEARLYKGIVESYKVGDKLLIKGGKKELETEITKLTKYPDFKSLLFHEKLYRVLPGLPSIRCGNDVYEKAYNFKLIQDHGALAITFKILDEKNWNGNNQKDHNEHHNNHHKNKNEDEKNKEKNKNEEKNNNKNEEKNNNKNNNKNDEKNNNKNEEKNNNKNNNKNEEKNNNKNDDKDKNKNKEKNNNNNNDENNNDDKKKKDKKKK